VPALKIPPGYFQTYDHLKIMIQNKLCMKRSILKDSWGTWQSVLRQISQKQDIFIPLVWHPVSSCI
jgi:hypothetical protein